MTSNEAGTDWIEPEEREQLRAELDDANKWVENLTETVSVMQRDYTAMVAERDALAADVARMMPVVEAADRIIAGMTHADYYAIAPPKNIPRLHVLRDHIDDYRQGET